MTKEMKNTQEKIQRDIQNLFTGQDSVMSRGRKRINKWEFRVRRVYKRCPRREWGSSKIQFMTWLKLSYGKGDEEAKACIEGI